MTKFLTIYQDKPYYVVNGNERGAFLPHHPRRYFDIAPTYAPRQLYLKGHLQADDLGPNDELPAQGAPDEQLLDDDDEDYVPEEEERTEERTDHAQQLNLW